MTILISESNKTPPQTTQVNSEISPKLDLSIEGMRSQQFSEGVFFFLLVGIVVFAGIVIAFINSKNQSTKFKTGEWLMFAAIIIGLVVAVILGAMQMLGGYLF